MLDKWNCKVFVEVCIHTVDISEACVGFSGYRIIASLALKAIIMITADDKFEVFLFFREIKVWNFM